MQLEQPAPQDSGNEVPQPDDNSPDVLEVDPPEPDDLDPDLDPPPPEEEEEIEVDGQKFVMPKSAAAKLNAERLMHGDYTQKTQAVAERNRQLDTREADFQRQQQEAQQYVDDIADVRSIEKQLAEYNKLDWNALISTDPQTAMLYQQQQRDLEAQRSEKVQSITQKQEQSRLTEQQAIAKQVQEAEVYLAREIPGITPERLASIEQYAAKRGIDKQQFSRGLINSPVIAVVLDKARMFDELQQKQAAAKPKVSVQEKPVTRISATRTSVKRDPEQMSTADWMAHRNKQVTKR